jgi:hypothetical protein
MVKTHFLIFIEILWDIINIFSRMNLKEKEKEKEKH